jgi:hypothetical protein
MPAMRVAMHGSFFAYVATVTVLAGVKHETMRPLEDPM